MSNCEHPNHCVKCSVKSCKNHCDRENYCSLECVCIGTHEGDPAMNQCTDCLSFENIDEREQERAIGETRKNMCERETNY
ncbi:MAG: DUF1540 domain-containing protein [Oscillospiraceae bacterium]|nr:DUF1540 domain-containing protein [Oscillospiraceae bacterium]